MRKLYVLENADDKFDLSWPAAVFERREDALDVAKSVYGAVDCEADSMIFEVVFFPCMVGGEDG